ncbi:DUF4234 domain-containing protein [Trujillonella endophytica]|uniref:DUF4234 domain-containing protein n=1 Tax=Trujillonella endophytica TaxID=673521 RepID=A0A1H8P7I2_9ACTN|nr:DUF4234 domain-containing protein [Trujillella endophytica]SEO37842.1 protein of unknown function [Trujillella endophytica]
MSTSQYPTGPSYPAPQPPQGYAAPGSYPAPMPSAPAGGYGLTSGPIGKVRSTGTCILLCIVTLGIYSLVWFFQVHEEMKRHTGNGLGGGLALVIAVVFGIASPYITSGEVGNMYERAGRPKPVSGSTGLWYFPGIFLVVGPIVWFVKTNGALNDYWRSLGAA